MDLLLKVIGKKLLTGIALVLVLVPALLFVLLNLLPLVLVQLPPNSWTLQHADAIIVLGTPANKYGKPSPTMRERVLAGVKLFKEGWGKYIILTGASAHNIYVEANVMAQEALRQGVPDNRLILEPLAQNTYQNAFNSVEIMNHYGWTSAIVVTSYAHARRSNLIFSHYPISYCLYACSDPAELSLFNRWLFDQREKYFVMTDLFSSKGVTLGLKPEQAIKMPEIARRTQEMHKQALRCLSGKR